MEVPVFSSYALGLSWTVLGARAVHSGDASLPTSLEHVPALQDLTKNAP